MSAGRGMAFGLALAALACRSAASHQQSLSVWPGETLQGYSTPFEEEEEQHQHQAEGFLDVDNAVAAQQRPEAPLRAGGAGTSRRVLASEFGGPMPDGPPCPALSKELVSSVAKENTVMVMCIDRLLLRRFARTWVRNVQRAGITYFLVAAMDPWSSKALGAMGVKQCFNAPPSQATHSDKEPYSWGNLRWHHTTWRKVHVVRSLYNLGFHVIHSDTDSTWWIDPLPWFIKNALQQPHHIVLTTDSLDTRNMLGDEGLEISATPYLTINTGVYFIKQYAEGDAFFKVWLSFENASIGHDQDGLNIVVRGGFRSNMQSHMPKSKWDTAQRLLYAALHNVTHVGLLPIHLFGNAYTYNVGRVHLQLNATLICTHWVWTGGSPESKIQHIRNAMKYADSPTWYGLPAPPDEYLYEYSHTSRRVHNGGGGKQDAQPEGPNAMREKLMLLSMDLTVPSEDQMPPGFNFFQLEKTEDMVQFHTAMATFQLRQAYWGILASAGLARTFVLPPFLCYCAKNWYMTQACRINGERHTKFPFACALSDLFRAKRVLSGITTPISGDKVMQVHIREWRFFEHEEIPQEIRASKLVLEAAAEPVGTVLDTQISGLKPSKRADGSHVLTVPWPMNTEQLGLLLKTAEGAPWRHVHLTNASKLVGGGFADPSIWAAFDTNINKYKAYWCCRSPADMERYNATSRVQLEILPLARLQLRPM